MRSIKSLLDGIQVEKFRFLVYNNITMIHLKPMKIEATKAGWLTIPLFYLLFFYFSVNCIQASILENLFYSFIILVTYAIPNITHETAHLIMGRKLNYNFPGFKIKFLKFAAVNMVEDFDPPKPYRDELKIAIIGPAIGLLTSTIIIILGFFSSLIFPSSIYPLLIITGAIVSGLSDILNVLIPFKNSDSDRIYKSLRNILKFS